jgi:hypothetical protein
MTLIEHVEKHLEFGEVLPASAGGYALLSVEKGRVR